MHFQLSKATKQVVLLYASTLLGTLFGVIASIINTRSLDPVAYGDVRYIQNIIQFIASLLLFGYFLSGSRLLALSSSEYESRQVRGCMVVILLGAAGIMLLSMLVCAMVHMNRPHIAKLFLISLPVCVYPLLSNYLNTTAQGDNHIVRLSVVRLLPIALYIPIAYWIYSVYGATTSRMVLLQWGLYSLVLVLVTISTKPLFQNLKGTFKRLNTENKAYGFQLYLGSLVMVATNYLAGISLGIFNADNVEVGYYTLALTVTAPLGMLPSIIGTTYFKEFAKLDHIPARVMRNTFWMTLGSCLVFVLLIKHIVVFLYTEDYLLVGTYASWLACGVCIHGFGDMLNRYLGSHGRGKEIRNASIANGIFKIFGYTLLVYLWNTPGALFTTILCDVIYSACIVYYYMRFVNEKRQHILNS